MAKFVTLRQAKDRLRVTSTDEDVDLQALVDQAEDHVLHWCSVTPRTQAIAATWTPETVPPVVVAAILVQTAELDRFRGDDAEGPSRPDSAPLAILVQQLLRAYHDAVIA